WFGWPGRFGWPGWFGWSGRFGWPGRFGGRDARRWSDGHDALDPRRCCDDLLELPREQPSGSRSELRPHDAPLREVRRRDPAPELPRHARLRAPRWGRDELRCRVFVEPHAVLLRHGSDRRLLVGLGPDRLGDVRRLQDAHRLGLPGTVDGLHRWQ